METKAKSRTSNKTRKSRARNLDLSPEKAAQELEEYYENFLTWMKEKGYWDINEDVIYDYIEKLTETKFPSTVWTIYLTLKTALLQKNNIDISSYGVTLEYIKRNCEGYVGQHYGSFTEKNIQKFLYKAPDDKYLSYKVVLILAICGSLKAREIYALKFADINDTGSSLVVTVRQERGNKKKTFVVAGKFYEIYEKFAKLRSCVLVKDSFFVYYTQGRFTTNPMGYNTVKNIPKRIAQYLKLKDVDSFTIHSFRSTWNKCLDDNCPVEQEKEPEPNEESLVEVKDEPMDLGVEFLEEYKEPEAIESTLNQIKEEEEEVIDDSHNNLAEKTRADFSIPSANTLSQDTFTFINPLTREDLKDHVHEVMKSTYHLGRLCASCKWSVKLYFNMCHQKSEKPKQNTNTESNYLIPSQQTLSLMATDQGGIIFLPTNTVTPANNTHSPQKEDGRYLELGPHFSPIFEAGDRRELKWEVRVDYKGHNFYAKLNFFNLNDLKYDYKISYLTKALEEHVLKDFSNSYSSEFQTSELPLPQDLHLRSAKTTMVLIVSVVAQRDLLRNSPVNFSSEIPKEFQYLEEVFESGLLSDLTLRVQDKKIDAHKLILASKSHKFKELFTSSIGGRSKMELEVNDLSFDAVREMLRFLYVGRFRQMDEEKAKQILIYASKYEISSVFAECEKVLCTFINDKNAVELINLADLNGARNLKVKAAEFIAKNVS